MEDTGSHHMYINGGRIVVHTTSSSYDLYTGGSCTGTATNGHYSSGTYTPGTRSLTFTVGSILTNATAP